MIQLPGKAYIARHGETVFNSARRMQGDLLHTPLTRAGMAQAEQMGVELASQLGKKPRLSLWSSPTGRALQTLLEELQLLRAAVKYVTRAVARA